MSDDGFSFTVSVDMDNVKKGLISALRRANRLEPAFAQLVKPLKADQADHAKAKMGPEDAWLAKSASTISRRGTRRKLLGSLPNRTVRVKSSMFGVIAYSKVPWSGAHQDGATVGHGAKLPARTFLWFSDKFLNSAERVFVDHVLGGW